MDIVQENTSRGFGLITFKDRYGYECNIQKSSLATDNAIWFGTKDATPQRCIPGRGWTPVEFPPDTLFNTRMHLTQEHVKFLLPILQHFAETGELKIKSPHLGTILV